MRNICYNGVMKKVLIPLTVLLYLSVFCTFAALIVIMVNEEQVFIPRILIIVSLALLLPILALEIINIFSVLSGFKAPRPNTFKTVMAFKIALVPYYVLNFAVCCVFAVCAVVPALFIIVTAAMVAAVVFTYFTVVSTSLHNVAFIWHMYKCGSITFLQTAAHVVLHFIFIADVIDAIFLYMNYSKKPLEAEGEEIWS